MLRVFAEAPENQTTCCQRYGPGHGRRLALASCLRSTNRADLEHGTAHDTALYDLFLRTPGDHGEGAWEGFIAEGREGDPTAAPSG